MDQFGMQEALKTLGLAEINKGCSTGNNWLGTTSNLIESYSPVDGKLIGKVAVSTKEDYEAAIAAGQKAYKTCTTMLDFSHIFVQGEGEQKISRGVTKLKVFWASRDRIG